MTKRIIEAARIKPGGNKTFRVCLISEGESSRGKYPPEFFSESNAAALADVLSFPNHPEDLERPEHRSPLTAVGHIGSPVTIETDPDTGKLGFWADYHVSKSKPEVADYLEEYAGKLGLSVYADSDGYIDPADGKFVYTDIDATDAYRSVDLVIAAGRGGKFAKVAESLGLRTDTSAPAGGKEEVLMDPEVKKAFDALNERFDGQTKVIENLTKALEGKAIAESQLQVDTAAAEKIAEGRIADYEKVNGLLAEAKLTESQEAGVRELAKTGAPFEEIEARITADKKVLAEALALDGSDDESGKHIAEAHRGSGSAKVAEFDVSVPGFGKVA